VGILDYHVVIRSRCVDLGLDYQHKADIIGLAYRYTFWRRLTLVEKIHFLIMRLDLQMMVRESARLGQLKFIWIQKKIVGVQQPSIMKVV